MAKPNAFVKISGNLLENEAVIQWLHELTKRFFVAICIGGGEQINEAFRDKGYPIKFGPLGRITESLTERQLARDVLERNQATVQDLLSDRGINALVIIPVDDVASVLCHVNGDVKLLAAYNGYDKLFLLTLKSRVEQKRLWLQNINKVLGSGHGSLDKIEVVGF